MLVTSVADPGCFSRIPKPNFFHPGSKRLRIPDPDCIKELKYSNPKNCFQALANMIQVVRPESGFFFSPIPDPGQKEPDPGSVPPTLLVTVPVCPLLVELAADNFLDSKDDPVLAADTDGGSAILHRLLRVLNLNEFVIRKKNRNEKHFKQRERGGGREVFLN
jgi:hypothetical protein